jgi:hypothetical protein
VIDIDEDCSGLTRVIDHWYMGRNRLGQKVITMVDTWEMIVNSHQLILTRLGNSFPSHGQDICPRNAPEYIRVSNVLDKVSAARPTLCMVAHPIVMGKVS